MPRLKRVPKVPPGRSGSNEFISRARSQDVDNILQLKSKVKEQINPRRPADIPLPLAFRRLAIKDNIATFRHPTTCASGILRQHQSPFEATVVHQLHKNGVAIVGKTNLDEFGMGSHSTNSYFGPVQNVPPFDRRSAGGSSGGSAVAIANRLAGLALGTDTGGSVRLPAAYTGVVGFKPSYGLVSRWGVVPYANSLDTVGILAHPDSSHSLRDVLTALRYYDPKDPTSLSSKSWKRMQRQRRELAELAGRVAKEDFFRKFKIGVPVEYNIEELEPAIRQAWTSALALLQEQGCTVVPVSLPNTKHALSAYYVLAPAEAASNLSKYDGVRYGNRKDSSDGAGDVLYSETRGEGFGDEVKRRIVLGSYTLSSKAIDNYFIKAQKVRRLVQRDFDRAFSLPNFLRPPEQFDLSDMDESIPLDNKLGPTQVDLIICPTAPTRPPTLGDISTQSAVDSYMNDVFTVPASLAGLPAISIPYPISKEYEEPGTPSFVGLQIIGQYADDFRVLLMADRIQQLRLPAKARRKTPPRKKKWVEVRRDNSKTPLQVRQVNQIENLPREPKTDKESTKLLRNALNDWEAVKSDELS